MTIPVEAINGLAVTATIPFKPPPDRPIRMVLINPRLPLGFWTYTETQAITGTQTTYPNLALPTLASLVPSGPFDLDLVDENVSTIDESIAYDVVGITGYSHPATPDGRARRSFPAAGRVGGRRRPLRQPVARCS